MNTKSLLLRVLPATLLLAVGLLTATRPASRAADPGPAGLQESTTLYAVADATVKSWQPNTNFGGEHTLELLYSAGDVMAEAVALVRFDLSSLPADAIIDLAIMELYLVGAAGDNPKSIAAYYVTGAWAENSVTWSTFPMADPMGIVASVDNVTGYKSWTVTSWADYWHNRPTENRGVYLRRLTSETSYFERIFESKDHNERMPRLVVRYHLPATATATATATRTATPTATRTPTFTATRTSTPTPSRTLTATATRSATASPTGTPTPTNTRPPIPNTPTLTATLPSGCSDLIVNGGFETGSLPPWGSSGQVGLGTGRNSPNGAWLGGSDGAVGELLQNVSIPGGAGPVRLEFWWRTEAEMEQPDDALDVLVQHAGQADRLLTLPAVAPLGQWQQTTVDLADYAGQTVAVTFLAHTDGEVPTTFRVDDVSLWACGAATPSPTLTATRTRTATPTPTTIATRTSTATLTRTPTVIPTRTQTATSTATTAPTLTPTATATTTPVVITFEENIPSPDNLRTQYCNNPATNKGVEFLNSGRIYTPGVGVNSPTYAYTNRFPSQEFGANDTVRIVFAAGQKQVGVKVGLDRSYFYPITAVMYAYSSTTPGTGFLTSATAYLGYGPTAITQDLAVTSAAGNIRSVVIAFGSSTPNFWGYEVLDDLRFSTLGPPCISDTIPPGVAISQPAADGLTFQSPAMRLAFVALDLGTGIAKLQVLFLNAGGTELSSFYVCGAAGAPTCLYDVFPYMASYDFQTSMPVNTARIRVKAWDFAGLMGQADRTVNFVNIGYFDLWAQAMEITQEIQPWLPTASQTPGGATLPPTFTYPAAPTAVPLVAGRTTVVRVYAGVYGTTSNQALNNVRAQLRCFTNASYTIPCAGAQVINPQNQPPNILGQITVRPGDSVDTKRRDTRLTWNFVLPDAWTAAGTIYLEAQILAPAGLAECAGCDNAGNRFRISGVKFETVPSFTNRVHFVRIRRELNGQTFEPTQAQMDAHIAYLRPRFPVDESTLPTAPDATWTWNDCGNSCDSDPNKNLGTRCQRILSDLVKAFPNKANKLAVYAVIDNGFPCAGVGGGGYSYGGALRTDSCPHEIGHAVGLAHAGPPPGHGSVCPPPGGSNCAECCLPDPNNPNSPCTNVWCETDWPWPHGTFPDYGFNVFNLSVVIPGTAESDPHDLMSYGGPAQLNMLSSRNWIRIFNAFTGQKLPYPKKTTTSPLNSLSYQERGQGVRSSRYLLVSGEQAGAGDWFLFPAFDLDYPTGTDDEPGEGEYSIVLRESGGAELFVRRFSIPVGHVDMPDRSGLAAALSFVELMPLSDGVTRLELRQGEDLLAAMERSEHAPVVEIISPTEDGFEGQPAAPIIRWEADDADGDPLRFNVQYSPDNGASWETVAQNLTGNSVTLDATNIVSGAQGRFRVWVSDGIHTASDISDGTFVVPNRMPTVEIVRPAGNITVPVSTTVNLEANAYDVDLGGLDGARVTWTSDRDGALGNGAQLSIATLSVGVHTITVRADDGVGGVATDTVQVTVTAAQEFTGNITEVFLPLILR
ncbi:MAG: DNRLRE domain-containing protein [Anaerolineae bacterium]